VGGSFNPKNRIETRPIYSRNSEDVKTVKAPERDYEDKNGNNGEVPREEDGLNKAPPHAETLGVPV